MLQICRSVHIFIPNFPCRQNYLILILCVVIRKHTIVILLQSIYLYRYELSRNACLSNFLCCLAFSIFFVLFMFFLHIWVFSVVLLLKELVLLGGVVFWGISMSCHFYTDNVFLQTFSKSAQRTLGPVLSRKYDYTHLIRPQD